MTTLILHSLVCGVCVLYLLSAEPPLIWSPRLRLIVSAILAIVFFLLFLPTAQAKDLPPNVNELATEEAADVLCVEAGTETRLAARVAFVIDNRVRKLGSPAPRGRGILTVLAMKHQWGHGCKTEPTIEVHDVARKLVRSKLHLLARPKWLTRDVLYVISEAESRRLGAQWGSKCLVKVSFGQAFYKECR